LLERLAAHADPLLGEDAPQGYQITGVGDELRLHRVLTPVHRLAFHQGTNLEARRPPAVLAEQQPGVGVQEGALAGRVSAQNDPALPVGREVERLHALELAKAEAVEAHQAASSSVPLPVARFA